MFIAYIVIAVLLSALLIFSGVGKLRKDPRIVHSIHDITKVEMKWFPWLAACEFAGAVGLLIGIFWWPLGVAAAIGVIIYFIGAIIAHLRVKDFKGVTNPIFPLVLAIAALVLRYLTR
ncbi:hypothetical protein KDA_41140 [Dictyobacter alpinus]|uniref:DoxX family protein n=1 Tax=Dictyobacter alpinus TaxID=2014873 RepID=A0A402BBG9_9CHLR|nr:DoxX family protein [Dictyobacter alpinus]GCE28630.1 hypothetical protein KDA_41140 [Dictyobacter alpinus]